VCYEGPAAERVWAVRCTRPLRLSDGGRAPGSWWAAVNTPAPKSPSLVLVINDTKLLMPCVKCFELGISNTCDEGVCGKEWWPQDHKEMVHGHEMMTMVEMHIK
jgi:hypothetical protein